MNTQILKGFSFTLIAAVLWGASGTFGQFLFQQRGINVEWLITVRMLVSGFCLLLFGWMREKTAIFSVWRNRKDALQMIAFSLGGMLAVQYTYFAAIRHSNAATATVLQYAGPVIIAVYLAFKYRRIPAPAELLAVILAALGVFLLVTHGNIHTLAISRMALFLGLAAAVALAVYTLQPVKLLSKYNSLVVTGWGMFCGGFAFSFVKAPWNMEGQWDGKTFLYTGLIIVFGTLIGFYLYMTAVKIIGAQKASLLASAEPLAATVLAVWWLNTPFLAMDWIGSFCIIITVFLLGRNIPQNGFTSAGSTAPGKLNTSMNRYGK